MSARDENDPRFYEFFPGAKRILVQEEIEIEELFRAVASDDSFSIRDLARRLVTEAYHEPPIVVGKAARKKLVAFQKKAKVVIEDRCLAEVFSSQALIVISQIASLSLSGRGARRKDAAARVARLLKQNFKALTGSPPTRITPYSGGRSYGPFIELLAAVYRVFGIKASADSQARTAIAAMEKNSSESGY